MRTSPLPTAVGRSREREHHEDAEAKSEKAMHAVPPIAGSRSRDLPYAATRCQWVERLIGWHARAQLSRRAGAERLGSAASRRPGRGGGRVPLPRLNLDCRQASGWNTGAFRKMGRMAHDSAAPILETPQRKWGRGAALEWGRAAEPRACGNSGSETRPHSLTLARFAKRQRPPGELHATHAIHERSGDIHATRLRAAACSRRRPGKSSSERRRFCFSGIFLAAS
jgi:hypothetical protein